MSGDAQDRKSSERSVFGVLGGIPAVVVSRLIFLDGLALVWLQWDGQAGSIVFTIKEAEVSSKDAADR